jgi:DHA1 family inner membrane transport protein
VATTVTGIIPAAVPLVLVLVGLGMTIGNIVGGIAADKDLKRYMLVFFGVLFVGLIGLFLTAHSVAGLLIFLFLIAAACSALSPSIQTRLMDVAHDSQSIAAALNHSALNVANASGAFLGSLAIAAGFGYLSPSLVGAILCLFGILIAVASFTVDRRRARKRAVSIQPLSTDTAEVSL